MQLKNRHNQTKKRYVPGLSAIIKLCECNYELIIQLLPRLTTECQFAFTLSPANGIEVRVECVVMERSPYTLLIKFEQKPAIPGWVESMTWTVRLYCDARMAEVVSFQEHRYLRPRYDYPNRNMYQADEKAQNNLFLGEWLGYVFQNRQSWHEGLN